MAILFTVWLLEGVAVAVAVGLVQEKEKTPTPEMSEKHSHWHLFWATHYLRKNVTSVGRIVTKKMERQGGTIFSRCDLYISFREALGNFEYMTIFLYLSRSISFESLKSSHYVLLEKCSKDGARLVARKWTVSSV